MTSAKYDRAALAATLPAPDHDSALDAYASLLREDVPEPTYAPSGAPSPMPQAPAPRSAATSSMDLLGDMHRRMQALVQGLEQERDTLTERLAQCERDNATMRGHLEAMAKEREFLQRLKTLYERKFASIRDLAQAQQGQLP